MPENLARAIDEQTIEIRKLTKQVEGEREDRLTERKRDRRQFGAILVTVVLAAALAVGGAYYLIDRNNQKWCGTLNILTDPSSPPPTTARARDQLAQLENLRTTFHCQRGDVPS